MPRRVLNSNVFAPKTVFVFAPRIASYSYSLLEPTQSLLKEYLLIPDKKLCKRGASADFWLLSFHQELTASFVM
jgi:hypothetical protein